MSEQYERKRVSVPLERHGRYAEVTNVSGDTSRPASVYLKPEAIYHARCEQPLTMTGCSSSTEELPNREEITMVVFHKIEACSPCRGATMWQLTNGKLQCQRCLRHKRVPRRRPSPVHVAAAACGLLVIIATWVAFAFGESEHQREIAQAAEPILTEQPDQDDAAADAHPGARLEERLKSADHSTLRTLDVSMPEFVELQRLDDNGRRQLLGLPAPCTPGVTAMMAPASSARRLVVLITCSGNPRR